MRGPGRRVLFRCIPGNKKNSPKSLLNLCPNECCDSHKAKSLRKISSYGVFYFPRHSIWKEKSCIDTLKQAKNLEITTACLLHYAQTMVLSK